jgi:hypothetical protein
MLHPVQNLIFGRSDVQIALRCGKVLSRSHVFESILSLLRCFPRFRLLPSFHLSKVLLPNSAVFSCNGNLNALSTYYQDKGDYDENDFSLVSDRRHGPTRRENDERNNGQAPGD